MEIMDFHHQKYQEHHQEIKNHPKSPSPTTSPSHEFSFTISLQPSQATSSTTTSTTSSASSSTAASKDKSPASKSSPPSFAVDLSPADDIFFHGHLLPLHLLSHLPISPRSSTNSLDSFTIPIKDGHDHHHHHHHQTGQDRHMINASSCNKICSEKIHRDEFEEIARESRQPTKSKSFSLFGLSSKWKKENGGDTTPRSSEERQKRKLKFDNVSHVLKRYMRRVFGNGKRENHVNFHRQGFSYSGNLSLRRKPELIGRRGEFSAPASMRTSPTNSGLLVPSSGTRSPTCPTSDSTMEELQSAIQAAIAHCKNSISTENKIVAP